MRPSWVLPAILGAAVLLLLASRTQRGATALQSALETAGEFVSRLSNTGLSFIARHEGLRLNPYLDAAGKWTIGYGHLILPTDPYHPYGPVTSITKEEADALLESDTSIAQGAVRELVTGIALSQNQFDALTSLVFNIGRGAFEGSTLLRKLNEGDIEGAWAEFPKWSKVRTGAGLVESAGLLARRNDEASLFIA